MPKPSKHIPQRTKDQIDAHFDNRGILLAFLKDKFPAGRVKGQEYRLGSLNGEKGNSFGMNLNGKRGVFEDFATGESGFGVVDLIRKARRIPFWDAAKIAAEYAGIEIEQTIAKPAPKKAPAPPDEHPELGKPESIHKYTDANGGLVTTTFRLPNKKIRPCSWTGKKWDWKQPKGLLPLYGLPTLAADTERPVLIVEGEKTLDAAAKLFPDYIVTCWPGGSGNLANIDFASLKGRRVVLWPDADEPGRKCMDSIAQRALAAGAVEVCMVDVPGDAPKGWDVADDAPNDWDVKAMLADAGTYTPPPSEWADLLRVNDGGAPDRAHCYSNTLTALRHAPELAGTVAFDDFGRRTMTIKPTPWSSVTPELWADIDDIRLRERLHGYGITVGMDDLRQAVENVARENTFHPVQDYLTGLEWDAKPRLDGWLTYHLGVDTSPYVEAVGARWMISAVARIFDPGCKADTALILEGPQYLGKSQALKTLAGEWFSDDIEKLGTKDAAMQIDGVWIIEMAELDSLNRADIDATKAFLSRQVDKFRPAYGRRVIEQPRRCIFAGTVNGDSYLRDETGNRRFWPVKCTAIDLEALAHDRDQIWAEAVKRYRDGAVWWLDDLNLIEAATDEQTARLTPDDTWTEIVLDFLSAKKETTVHEILIDALHISISEHGQREQTRIAKILNRVGWTRIRRRVQDGRKWVYVREL